MRALVGLMLVLVAIWGSGLFAWLLLKSMYLLAVLLVDTVTHPVFLLLFFLFTLCNGAHRKNRLQ